MAGHEKPIEGATNVWLTPKWIIDALGPFDLDPCAAPEPRPFEIAPWTICPPDDGLKTAWMFGTHRAFAFVNPPYGRQTGAWLDKLAKHNYGIALVFARTETPYMQRALRAAAARCFMAKRVTFLRPDGTPGPGNSGAPSMLLAFGDEASFRLRKSGIKGVYL